MVKVHRGYLFASYLSLLILGLADNIRGPLFPDLLGAFSLDNRRGSLFFSIASAMIVVGGYSAGFLLNRWGRIRTLQLALLVFTGSLFGLWQSSNFSEIMACVAFFGWAMGMMGVLQNVMVIEASPPAQVQKWQAGLQSMYGLASLSAPLLVAVSRVFSSSWQTPFLIAAVLSLVVLVATFFFAELEKTLVPVDPLKVVERESSKPSFFFGAMIAVYVATEIGISSHLAQFARESEGWSFMDANYLNAIFFVGMFGGRFLFVFWRPEASLKTQMNLSLAGSAIAVAFGLFVHPVGLAIAGLTLAPFYPLSMTAAGKMFPRALGSVTSTAIGISGLTVVTMQTGVGILADQYNLKTALLLGPAFSILALSMIFSYRKIFAKEIP